MIIRLASLCEVVRGQLLNHPPVAGVDRFVFEADRVRRGDCFINVDNTTEASHQAVARGAYAVIHEGVQPIMDDEIGWIRVGSMERALSGLSRYLLLEGRISLFCAEPAVCDLVDALVVGSGLVVRPSHRELVVLLQKPDPPPAILLETGHIHAESALPLQPASPLLRARGGLFESVVYHRDALFTVPLPALFLPQLSMAVGFLSKRGLRWRFPVGGTLLKSRFRPLFLGTGLRPVGFGQSTRAAICDRPAFAGQRQEAINFIKEVAPWAKVAVLSPESSAHAIDALRATAFSYAYLEGVDIEELTALLERQNHQPTLFG